MQDYILKEFKGTGAWKGFISYFILANITNCEYNGFFSLKICVSCVYVISVPLSVCSSWT